MSGFEEIFSRADRNTVRLIKLPPLETIDQPYQADEVRLKNELAETLLHMMDAVKKSPDYLDPQAEKIATAHN